MPKLSRSRLFFIVGFFLIALSCLLVRLGFIQIFKSSKYLSLAQNQSRAVIEMQPVRGEILDRGGHKLALDVRLDSVYAVARQIKNKEHVADKLSQVLGLNRAFVLKRLHKDKLFVWIARKITPQQSAMLKKLKLEGIDFVKESKRVYPKNETASHLIGFTGIDNNGLEGIELSYDSFLKGVPGWRMAQKDAKQRELISKELQMVPPVDGFTIHLTIDEVIQTLAEKELTETCRKYNAKGGSIIVMEPKTGDVLAMANYPIYDLNDSKRATPESKRNRAVTDLFEPGSVFKSFTVASIIENKVFSMNEKFFCENGSWAVAGKVLHDHHGSGTLTYREVIERSSNIGTVKGAMRLGSEKLYKTLRAFGFGSEPTGIPIAGEIGGILHHPRNWSRSSIINIPIGHGVALTPIQLTAAVNALANDGILMKPRIITLIDDQDGQIIKKIDPEVVRRAVSKETALEVRSVLEGVVARGTGKKAKVAGFRAAGKTGTAQKILPGGGYSHDHFIGSFVGFVPYDEPKITILVTIDEPHPVYYGGEVAAPAFSRLSAAILAYWRIAQTSTPPEVIQSVTSKKKSGARATLPAKSINNKSQLSVPIQ